ncbi:LmbU family transcriptional regulator [Nonomuraea composti]|uniref:LmbU family transcriptional regulator n=1 Tax=Nonomuraea composti TaxID=2720023 RepID=UPI0014396CA5
MNAVERRAGQGQSQILVTRTGLKIPDRTAFEAWREAGLRLARIADSSVWCLGDWLVYGQDRYSGRYREVVDLVGLDYQTLRNYAWIARRFPLDRRREELSFQHHAEVAALAPELQAQWLERAHAEGWSRNTLRKHLRGQRDRSATPSLPRLDVPPEQVARWRTAAAQAERDFGAWIVDTLDAGAAHILRPHDEETQRGPHFGT